MSCISNASFDSQQSVPVITPRELFILQPLGILVFVSLLFFWQQYPEPEFIVGGGAFISMGLALRGFTPWDGEMLELDEKGLWYK